jgi:ParB-like chromosome segregation protein Spo0J
LDGHVRIEALKDLGLVEVECLISIDDETYTFNKRVNRLVPVQEHRMIVKAVERGVPENQIAEALGLEVTSVRRRSRMLNSWSIHERKSQKADRR